MKEKKEPKNIMKMSELKIAIWLHDTYEKYAAEFGWATHKNCRVDFGELPKQNQQVMMAVAHEILRHQTEHLTKIEDRLQQLCYCDQADGTFFGPKNKRGICAFCYVRQKIL